MALTRRSFFAAISALCVAQRLPLPPPAPMGLGALVQEGLAGTVGGIPRAEFSFWRNQQAIALANPERFAHLNVAMRDLYSRCERG